MKHTREEFVDALRKAADFLEKNIAVPVPHEQTLYWWSGDYEWEENPTAGSDGVRAFVAAAPQIEKKFDDDDAWVVYDLGPVKMKYGCKRETVCERVVIGKRTIAAEPERVIPAQAEYEVELVEWKCSPLLRGR